MKRTTPSHAATDRQRNQEDTLRESNTRFAQVTAQNRTIVWEVDADGLYTYASHVALDVLGYRPDELVGSLHFYDLHPATGREAFKQAALAVFARKEPFINLVNAAQRKDGATVWLSTNGAPLLHDDGTLRGYRGADTDVTERRMLEPHLQQAQKMDSVGRLAGGVAHDFNNMLGVILGHVELIMDKVEPASPLFADLLEIKQATEHSANLTRQLLTFARKQTINPQILDLNTTISGMLNLLQRLLGENIELAWKPGAALWPVKMDPAQLNQVLVNLCINARDAITGQGRVSLETKNLHLAQAGRGAPADAIPGDYVTLEVRDDGCGMTPEAMAHVFEPFFTTKEQGKGTGLGLATVYGVIKQHHGFITVSSTPGQGTAFSICLPRYQPPPHQADKPHHA